MSLSPGLGGGHRLAGSSLLTVAAVMVCVQAEPDGGDLVLACLNSFIPCHFSRAARRTRACRWLSFHGGSDFGLYISGTGGWRFGFGAFNIFIPCTLLPDLRQVNRLAGGSLRTVAAILVRIQAERKGGDLLLVCVNNFIPFTFLPGCAEDTRLPVALFSRSQ